MRVLITGASGFVGKEIVKECQNSGFETVQLVSHRSQKNECQKNENFFKVMAIDITDYKNLRQLEKTENVDVLIHAAGLAHQFGDTKKEEFNLVNVQGTKNISELAAQIKVKQFILISSTAVYGAFENINGKEKNKNQGVFDENSQTNPKTLYAKSKLEAEKICTEICEKNKIPLTILRLSPVIGEGNRGNVERLVKAIERKRFVWIGNGENLKSLIYKNDVAGACVKIIEEKTDATEIFNLSAEPLPLKNFVDEISRRLKRKVPEFSIPAIFSKLIFGINKKTLRSKKIYKFEQTFEKWLAVDIYKSEKIKHKYNFTPKFSIAEGIRKQVDWYKLNKDRNL